MHPNDSSITLPLFPFETFDNSMKYSNFNFTRKYSYTNIQFCRASRFVFNNNITLGINTYNFDVQFYLH